MLMLKASETVAKRYGIPRDRQDADCLRAQRLTAEAQAEGVVDQESVPVTATMTVVDKATGETSRKEVTRTRDEGSRADTSAEGLAALKPVIEGGVITAGNASQLSDGA